MRNAIDKEFHKSEMPIYLIEMEEATKRWVDLSGTRFIPQNKFPEFLRRACLVLRALSSHASPLILTEKLFHSIKAYNHSGSDAEIAMDDAMLILILYACQFNEEMIPGIDRMVQRAYSPRGELKLNIKDRKGFLYFHWAAMYMKYDHFARLRAAYGDLLTRPCPINSPFFGNDGLGVLAAAHISQDRRVILFPIHIASLFANYDTLAVLLENGESVNCRGHYCPWKMPLHFAIELQNSELMIFLLARGATAEPHCERGMAQAVSFFYWQAVFGTVDTLRVSLAVRAVKLGRNILENEDLIRQAMQSNAFVDILDTQPGEEPDLRLSFNIAQYSSRVGNTEQVRFLLNTMPWLKTARDSCRFNLFNEAMHSQNASTLQLLIDEGVDGANVTQGGYNPIQQALFVYENEALADLVLYITQRAEIRKGSYPYFLRHHNKTAELLWLLSRTAIINFPKDILLIIFGKAMIRLIEIQKTENTRLAIASPENTLGFFRACLRTPLSSFRPQILRILADYLENDAQLLLVAKGNNCQALLERMDSMPKLALSSLTGESMSTSLRQLDWRLEDKFIEDFPDILLLARYFHTARNSRSDLLALANNSSQTKQIRSYAAFVLSVQYLAENEDSSAQKWRAAALEFDSTLVGVLHAFGVAHLTSQSEPIYKASSFEAN